MVLLLRSQRSEKSVDGPRNSIVCRSRLKPEKPIVQRKRLVGKQNVEVMRLELLSILDRVDRHLGMAFDNFGEKALLVRRKMRDQDKGHAGIWIEVFEDFLKGLEAARRGAKPYDRIWECRRLLLLGFALHCNGDWKQSVQFVGIGRHWGRFILAVLLAYGFNRSVIIGLALLMVGRLPRAVVWTLFAHFTVFHGGLPDQTKDIPATVTAGWCFLQWSDGVERGRTLHFTCRSVGLRADAATTTAFEIALRLHVAGSRRAPLGDGPGAATDQPSHVSRTPRAKIQRGL